MIDVVFTESACGSLKMAQDYGKGRYQGGCVGVILRRKDGSEPTKAEIAEAQRKAEEEARRKWESAVPLGGSARDVFGFPLGLSIGDIRTPLCMESRIDAMKTMHGSWNEFLQDLVTEQFRRMNMEIETVRSRIANGEDARIWYSSTPDELCGLYWLMDELRELPEGHGKLLGIRLPELDEHGDSIRTYQGWGEIEPGEFHRFLDLAQPISDTLRIHYFSNGWKNLNEENAPLRAVLNGKLMSAPESLYDSYIQEEIGKQPGQFWEPMVIGNIIGRCQLGIGDGILHQRIESMMQQWGLEILQPDPDGGYRRYLKKI